MVKNDDGIGIEEWRVALEQALAEMEEPPDDGGLTAPQIAEILDLAASTTRAMIHKLAKAGKLIPFKGRRKNLFGESKSTYLYRLSDDG